MQAAEASLRDMNIYDPDPYIYATMLSKIRRASLDCYVRQIASNDTIESRATIMTQNYVKIADPCTFRLIAKNVTNLLPKDQQHLKTKTYKQLDELIRFACTAALCSDVEGGCFFATSQSLHPTCATSIEPLLDLSRINKRSNMCC